MSNKKDLKKAINGICKGLFGECVAATLYSAKIDDSNAEALLSSIVMTNNDFIRRISHPEPGMDQKKYFKTLKEDFSGRVSEIVDQINNLH